MSARLALARIGRWPRLAAAGVCLLLAAVTALEDAGGGAGAAPSSGRVVVVAARTLPIGQVLTGRDLRTARWPRALAPPGSTPTPQRLTGRVLAGPLAAGEPVTPRRLVDPGLTAGLGADTVAMPVDVDTDVRGLVRAGGHVDLLAATRPDSLGPGPPATQRTADLVAGSVRVLAVLAVPAGPAAEVSGCRLVLALRRDQALRIAGLRSARVFTALATAP